MCLPAVAMSPNQMRLVLPSPPSSTNTLSWGWSCDLSPRFAAPSSSYGRIKNCTVKDVHL